MKESDVGGLAAQSGPESCVVARKGRGEALTRVRAKPLNNAGQPAAEGVDGRGLGKGNPPQQDAIRASTQSPAQSIAIAN